jgi:hypothetical protein
MAKDTFTGPLIALGGLAGGAGVSSPREYSDEIGPSIFWGGVAIPASSGPASKDRTGPGSIASVYLASPIRTINCAPVAGAVNLTVAGLPTAGTPLVNVTTYAAGIGVGTPVLTSGGVATTGIALDMGLDLATFAATGGSPSGGTATLTGTSAGNAWRYQVGQWIGCLNGGTGGVTRMSQIVGIAGAVLSINPAPVAASGQITLSNRYNPNQYGASQTTPTSISSTASAGSARILIPELGTTRGVGVTAAASTNGQVLIQGIGAFGMQVSEIITAVAGTTVWGKKTYDIFISATPLFSDATGGHNLTVKTSDFIGFPMSVMDASSIVAATFAGTQLVYTGTSTAIIIPADLTYPATTTTGDPRGGLQLSANGPVTGPTGTPPVLNGTNLLVVDQRLNPLQVALSTTINPGPLLGVPGV